LCCAIRVYAVEYASNAESSDSADSEWSLLQEISKNRFVLRTFGQQTGGNWWRSEENGCGLVKWTDSRLLWWGDCQACAIGAQMPKSQWGLHRKINLCLSSSDINIWINKVLFCL
jgi:hypothetical protein